MNFCPTPTPKQAQGMLVGDATIKQTTNKQTTNKQQTNNKQTTNKVAAIVRINVSCC
jgi:hypothetical protein